MKIITLLHFISLSLFFEINTYASQELTLIVNIDDDQSSKKRSNSILSKIGNRLSSHTYTQSQKSNVIIDNLDYKQLYTLNNIKNDILFITNYNNIILSDTVIKSPKNVFFNFVGYQEYVHDYKIYLTELTTGNKLKKVFGSDYYKSSIHGIEDQLEKFVNGIKLIRSEKSIQLNEFNNLINILSIIDNKIERLQKEFKNSNVSIQKFIIASNTLKFN